MKKANNTTTNPVPVQQVDAPSENIQEAPTKETPPDPTQDENVVDPSIDNSDEAQDTEATDPTDTAIEEQDLEPTDGEEADTPTKEEQ